MGAYWFAGLWGVAMVAVLISAIRLSYRVEARSEGLRNTSGVPRKAMWVHTMLNWHVARDAETQALRRQMNTRFLIILAGFVLFSVALWSVGAFRR
jgi:hypothetical protein